jgi:sulfonate transport system permease protein
MTVLDTESDVAQNAGAESRGGVAVASARTASAQERLAAGPAGVEQITIEPTSGGRRFSVPRPIRRAVGPILLILAWYVAVEGGYMSSKILAPPQDVAEKFWDLTRDGRLPSAIAVSGERVLYGFIIGGSIAVVLALLAGLFRLGEDIIDSTVGMLRTLPWVGLIPLFIGWFGIDEKPKIALVALAVAFPLYLNLYGGIRNVDVQLIEAGKTLGLNRLGLIRHVVLPGALPGALVGLRYSLGTAWLALVFAEQVNATNGIGYLMSNAQQFFQTDVIVVCLVVYALLGLIADTIVRIAIRYLLAWRPAFSGT